MVPLLSSGPGAQKSHVVWFVVDEPRKVPSSLHCVLHLLQETPAIPHDGSLIIVRAAIKDYHLHSTYTVLVQIHKEVTKNFINENVKSVINK